MNKNIIIGIVILLFGGACFYIGRITTPEVSTVVESQVNVDSLRQVFLAGTVDSTTYSELIGRYGDLLQRFRNRVAPPNVPGPIPVEPEEPVFRASAPFDTTLPLTFISIVEDDTLSTRDSARLKFDLSYIGEPFNGFIVDGVKIGIPNIYVPVRRRDPSITVTGNILSVVVLGAVHSGIPGGGLGVNVGPVDVGAVYHSDNSFTYLAGWRIKIF